MVSYGICSLICNLAFIYNFRHSFFYNINMLLLPYDCLTFEWMFPDKYSQIVQVNSGQLILPTKLTSEIDESLSHWGMLTTSNHNVGACFVWKLPACKSRTYFGDTKLYGQGWVDNKILIVGSLTHHSICFHC